MNTPQRDPRNWEVIVGNVGSVYVQSGGNENDARREYNIWVALSKLPFGRESGESVTLLRDGEPFKEYQHANRKTPPAG